MWEKHLSGNEVTGYVPLVHDPFDQKTQQDEMDKIKYPKMEFGWRGIWNNLYRMPYSFRFNWFENGSFEGTICLILHSFARQFAHISNCCKLANDVIFTNKS